MTQSITPPLRERPAIELTTRDILAFDVLKSILSRENAKPNLYAPDYARDSYKMVDAMLQARGE